MNKKILNHLNKKKSNKIFSSKKLLLLLGSSTIATVPVISSIAVGNNSMNMNLYSGAYSLGDKDFDSYNSLMNYVDKNSKTINVEGNNSKWSVTLNGVTRTYNDPNVLRNEVYNQLISRKQVKTDVNLADYVGPKGVLGLTNQEVWKHISYDVNSKNTIYQGANDQVFNTQDEAYDSYFQTKEGYHFNGINFSNKNDLKQYLEKEYFPNRNTKNTVVITSPSGNSLPIDLTKANAYDELSSFINNNAEIRINYKNDGGEQVDITRDNVQSQMDKVNLHDLNYQHVLSNQGESRYIIDNKDSADLIGPYFYQGVLDVSSFKNKDMWKKVNGVTKSVFTQSRIDSIIGSFFSSIINDDNNLNKIQAENGEKKPLLFRTLLSIGEDEKSYDQWFMDELNRLSPQLSKEVIEANDSMMSGKKYNSIYKIPVLYSFLLQRAISWNLGQEVVNLIVDYFTNVCNLIQDVLEFVSLYSSSLLLSKDKKTKFDMVKFFQIGNPEYDLNTSTEYFLNEMRTNYPNLVAMCFAYTQAENNISLAGGLIPFNSVSFDFLYEDGLMDSIDLYSIKNELRGVYDTFSQLSADDMVNYFVVNNKNPEIKNIETKYPDKSQWNEALKNIKTPKSNQSVELLLSSIGAKNNQYFALAESLLSTEISIFLETGTIVNGGYLDQLSKVKNNKNLVSLFINLVKGNEGKIKAYRIYLAFMLDLNTGTNIFNDGKSNISNDEFFRRLSYLIATIFGTSLLVSQSMIKLYESRSYVVIESYNNPIFEVIENASDNGSIGGDRISINVGENLIDGSMRPWDGDRHSVNGISPSVAGGSINLIDFDIQLDPLTDAIYNSSQTDIDRIINEGLSMTPINRSPSSATLVNPVDNAQVIQASSFNDQADLISLNSNVIDATNEVVPTFEKNKLSWWAGYIDKFQKIKDIVTKVLDYAVQIFAATLTVLEFAFFFYDLFKETYTQNFYQYTTADGTSFYWNGGLSVSKYFGFVNYEISNINQMELVNPVAITLPQLESYYYYDGIKYYDSSELKRRILLNYINGEDTPKNPKFNKYYALIGNEDATSKTITELVDKVIKSLNITKNENGSFNINNLNKESPYIQTLSASYDNGYVVSDKDNNITLVQNIIDNIRPAYFVKLPKLNGTNVAQGEAGVIDKLPGKYWNGMSVVDNGEMKDVLFDNSANDLKPGLEGQNIWNKDNFSESNYSTASYQSKQKLLANFKTKFTPASKEVLDVSLSTNKYSALANGVSLQYIYEMKDTRTNRIYTFYSLANATSYLNDAINFTKHVDNNGTKIYFEGLYFENKNQLYRWVHNNMTSIK
ncbi:hypothetical protein [Malacoplasma iowae]|uniref:hypothetical protein n=1 Tax=Malacoplasma iowae TaxID=2116 RepID=UPI003872E15D|nr:hypothetical protein QX179_04655 [Malacoplasma iowae]